MPTESLADIKAAYDQTQDHLLRRALQALAIVDHPADVLLSFDEKIRQKINDFALMSEKPEPRHYVDWVLESIRELLP